MPSLCISRSEQEDETELFRRPFKICTPFRTASKCRSRNALIAGLPGCSSVKILRRTNLHSKNLSHSSLHIRRVFLGAISNFLLKKNSKCTLAKQCLTKRKCRLFSFYFSLFPAATFARQEYRFPLAGIFLWLAFFSLAAVLLFDSASSAGRVWLGELTELCLGVCSDVCSGDRLLPVCTTAMCS